MKSILNNYLFWKTIWQYHWIKIFFSLNIILDVYIYWSFGCHLFWRVVCSNSYNESIILFYWFVAIIYIFLAMNLLSEIYIASIFPCYVSHLFALLFVPFLFVCVAFLRQNFLIKFITIFLSIIIFHVLFKNSLPIPWACHCILFLRLNF